MTTSRGTCHWAVSTLTSIKPQTAIAYIFTILNSLVSFLTNNFQIVQSKNQEEIKKINFAQFNFRSRYICPLSRLFDFHAGAVEDRLGRAPSSYHLYISSHLLERALDKANSFSSFLVIPQSPRFWNKRKWLHARDEIDWSGINWIDLTSSFCNSWTHPVSLLPLQ